MLNILIAGASGMIGSLIVESCLQKDEIKQVTSITRKPSGIQHAKLIEVIHTDFLDFSAIEHHFAYQDVCFYCIGVYTGAVPEKAFNTITIDYTKAFAEMLQRKSPNATFCFLSGQGADQLEKSRVLFAKSKGIAENILLHLNFPATYLFRPGYIYPVSPRKEPNLMYTIIRLIFKPIAAIYPNIGISSIDLAHSMVYIGLNKGNQTIYENADIRAIVKNRQ
jgi:nucleoside-diphosphate-sugar epimerase